MMIHKIIQTGLMLSVLLMIPGALKGVADPPAWVKASILVPGVLGLVMAFVGLLALIWA
jgi:hypothetical protein